MYYRKSRKLNVMLLATIVCAVVCAMAVFMPTQSADANSADRNYYGENSQGVIITGKDCPIVVDSELLTFDIYKNEPTSNGMTFASSSQDDSVNTGFYKKQVTAEYTFRNPTENAITANLVFPFGFYTSYYVEKTELSQYGISVDGTEIPCNLRATYCEDPSYYDWSDAIDLEEMRKNLVDDFQDDDFYKQGDSVTAYTLTFSNKTAADGYVLCLDWKGLNKRSIVSSEYMHYDYNNSVRTKHVCTISSYTDEYVFYVIGNAVTQEELLSRLKVYTDYELEDEVNVDFSLTADPEAKTVKDLFLYHREDESISEVDWYNVALRCIKEYNSYSIASLYSFNPTYYMLCWFEYDLTFTPGKTLTNTVTAPLYPDQNGWYVPSKYVFHYFLSPASSWADFKDLTVVVNTDMYLIDNEIVGVESHEGYYVWQYDTLPEGELSFTLCESEEPTKFTSSMGTALGIIIVVICIIAVFLIILPIIGVVVGLIIVIVVIKKKNRKSE